MSTETDHTSAGTEAERDKRWTGYAYPAQEEPPDPGFGDTAAEAENEAAAENEAEIEAEHEAEAGTGTEHEAEAGIDTGTEADAEAETPAEAEANVEEQDGFVAVQSAEEDSQEAAATPVALHSGADPLLSAETESDLLSRWTEIQMSFVEDPLASVQSADALIAEIGAAQLASFQERRSSLAGGWQSGQPDTEELRLALREYRDFISVILPK
jgi:hypothetical protein